MIFPLTILAVLLVLAAMAISVLSVVAARGFLRRLDEPLQGVDCRATLILPLTGEAPQFEALVGALEAQSLPPRRLIVAVESERDPAWARATALAPRSRLPIEVVIAGEAGTCAQKNGNQIAALARVDGQDDVVVLLDADIVPQRAWLATLVGPLQEGAADITTGYRWPQIAQATLGAHLIAAIDRPIAVLPRVPGWARMVWGGSVALSRGSLQALDAPRTLGRALSDDCMIGERAAAQGLRILTRRSLLVPTPLASGFVEAWRFGRRQYQILGLYRPQLHLLSLAAVSTRLAAWIIILANLAGSMWALGAAVVLLGLAIAAHEGRRQIAARLQLADPVPVRVTQTLLVLAQPLVDAVHWSMLVAGCWRRRVQWGHVTYDVAGPQAIRAVHRRPWPGSS